MLNAAHVFGHVASVPDCAHLDQLIRSMEDAGRALDSGRFELGDAALTDALGALGALYGELPPDASPAAIGQLELLYDTCIRALGDAYGGGKGALVPAIGVLRSLRATVGGAPIVAIRHAA